MVSTTDLELAVRNPALIFRVLNRLYYKLKPTTGLDILEADWDTLIILDACTYGMFDEMSELPGELSARRSRASCTAEFLETTFDDQELLDTVYVTANPMLSRKSSDVDVTFHDVVNVWGEDDSWDDSVHTVRPETMTQRVLDTIEEYPNKRIIAHYIQPHYPFLGETGERHFNFDTDELQKVSNDLNFWMQVMVGELDVDDETLWQAFRENLKLSLPHIKHLLNEIEGRTVVTADHGQMIGERARPFPIREYGHPCGVHTDMLVTVPWQVYESGSRREIRANKSNLSTDIKNEDDVKSRLRNLGYAE